MHSILQITKCLIFRIDFSERKLEQVILASGKVCGGNNGRQRYTKLRLSKTLHFIIYCLCSSSGGETLWATQAQMAGLLGVFWGSFGLHNWYLGQKKQGMAHLALIGLGTIFLVAAAVLSTKVETTSTLFADSTSVALGSYKIYITLSLIIAVRNALRRFISGVMTLLQGDAGLGLLRRRGILVVA